MTGRVYELDGHRIEVSKPGKVLFPQSGITKGDLADYYARIAEVALPYWRDRPLTMQRFPDGIGKEGFFQKNIPEYFPDWVRRSEMPKEDGTVRYVLVNNCATFAYLADQGMVTPHIGLSRVDRPNHPDRMVFDLDPPGKDFGKVQVAARRFREILDERGLRSFVQTTGSRGLHVILPLDRSRNFDEVREIARQLAGRLAERYPGELTTEQRKAKRGDRVYLDTGRNAYGQTHVAPYGVRALDDAPVATPVEWDEALSGAMRAGKYGIKNIFRRLGAKEDPWATIDDEPLDAASLVR
ncbi:ATP-dependent DNA ligase [Stappia sp. F7233]|uniref:ATP-dependent DNA ligase n=1 Tax=Stappia albiluteola TaxID=2758565 RepID=A0A839AET8_9HYPH|nr:non-homologous end-joining DNA ligase [Stappia albiluteola]MBA5777548.1 ATP-dependent DNA ligase [Stappia albiluteola]